MQAVKLNKSNWKPPERGFEVSLRVTSSIIRPEKITATVNIQPTKIRHAIDEVRKNHNWFIEANPSLATIQEHIDNILTRIQPYASEFENLTDCFISLDVYIYREEFEAYHHARPSFTIEEKWIKLLQQINAAFVLD